MDQPPPIPEMPPSTPSAGSTPTMSLPARLLNVFAVPGEVFNEVKAVPVRTANWLVPALIASVVGVLSIFIVFSQPAIQQHLREKQTAAMEKKFEKEIQAGRMTREKADQTLEAMEKFFGPTMLIASGSISFVFYSFARLFFWALVLWLLGRWWFHSPFGYLKSAEIAGLAGMIGVLGTIVTVLLQVNFSSQSATPSLALTVGDFDESKPSHMLLAMVNLFDLWQVGVLGVGLARLTGAPFLRATLPVLVVWTLVSALLGGLSVLAVRLGS